MSVGGYPGHDLSDAVLLTDEEYAALKNAESQGKAICWDGDRPVVVDRAMPLTELRAMRLADISDSANARLSELSAAYPAFELQSWAQQAREAEALAADQSSAAPLLSAIATARGLTVVELSARVRAKVAAYAEASGQIIGQRQALEDALMAVDLLAQDAAAQLEAIQWPA